MVGPKPPRPESERPLLKEAVCTILPQSDDVAVEMFIRAMDVPLVSIGRKVRIEFDGFPALQVTGWPSVSVGSFGGTVKVVDFVNTILVNSGFWWFPIHRMSPGRYNCAMEVAPRDGLCWTVYRCGYSGGDSSMDSRPVWYKEPAQDASIQKRKKPKKNEPETFHRRRCAAPRLVPYGHSVASSLRQFSRGEPGSVLWRNSSISSYRETNPLVERNSPAGSKVSARCL